MQRVFVTLLAGAPNVDDRVLTVVRALTDFIYYAQFQLHTLGNPQSNAILP